MTEKEIKKLQDLIEDKVVKFASDCEEEERFTMEVFLDEDREDTPYADVNGYIGVSGYIEDDYHCGYGNGTGAFVVTSVCCSLDIDAYDENGQYINIDSSAIEQNVKSAIYYS